MFTYYLRDGYETLRKQRRDIERERLDKGDDNPYPSWEALRREDREDDPSVVLVVEDSEGRVVRRLTAPTSQGLHRIAWNLRYPSLDPVSLEGPEFHPPWWQAPEGPLVLPGTYRATLAKRVEGKLTPLGKGVSFEVRPLPVESPLVTDDRAGLLAFQNETAALSRAVLGAIRSMGELQSRIDHLEVAIERTPALPESFRERLEAFETSLEDLGVVMTGDSTLTRRNQPGAVVDRRSGREHRRRALG